MQPNPQVDQQRPSASGMSPNRRALIREFLATLLVVALLWWIASPLTYAPASAGLHSRYLLEGAQAACAGLGQPLTQTQCGELAMRLHTRLGLVLALLAATGWFSLRLSQSRLSLLATCCAIVSVHLALFSVLFWVRSSAGLPLAAWVAVAFGACGLLLAGIQPGQPARQASVQWFVFPGWVFFTGLGLIWLVDYAARGHLKFRYVGVLHLRNLVFAYLLFALAATAAKPALGALARVFAKFDRQALSESVVNAGRSSWQAKLRSNMLPIVYLALTFCIAAYTWLDWYSHKKPGGPEQPLPSTATELMRLPMFFLLGWIIHRWALQGHVGRAAVAGIFTVLAIMAGHIGLKDHGQVLLVGIFCVTAVGLMMAVRLRASGAARVVAVGAVIAMVVGGIALLKQFGHFVSTTVAQRLEILENPFDAPVDYLAELGWLANATPSGGFGLTQVPWCGTVATFEAKAICYAAPMQTQSDYVFAALAAIWGPWSAIGITAALGLWLAAACASRYFARQRQADTDPAGIGFWAFAAFAAVLIVQMVYSSMAAVGLVPLTGVPFPLIAWGTAGLVSSALMLGMAARR